MQSWSGFFWQKTARTSQLLNPKQPKLIDLRVNWATWHCLAKRANPALPQPVPTLENLRGKWLLQKQAWSKEAWVFFLQFFFFFGRKTETTKHDFQNSLSDLQLQLKQKRPRLHGRDYCLWASWPQKKRGGVNNTNTLLSSFQTDYSHSDPTLSEVFPRTSETETFLFSRLLATGICIYTTVLIHCWY